MFTLIPLGLFNFIWKAVYNATRSRQHLHTFLRFFFPFFFQAFKGNTGNHNISRCSTIFPCMSKFVVLYPYLSLLSRHTYSKLLLMIKFNCWLITVAHMLLFTFYVVYIVIICIVFLALRDFSRRRFIRHCFIIVIIIDAHNRLYLKSKKPMIATQIHNNLPWSWPI